MEEFVVRAFMCLLVVMIAAKWMAQDYAKAHPEDAEQIKQAASKKFASMVKKRLE